MIKFHKIRYRNFLSTGNNWTEIVLDQNKNTLVVGTNGAGKSTMLDAMSFALFGKPHRNINKPQLVNSINQQRCRVEIEFTVHGSHFKIVRGMKPNKFEIWKDKELINQNSHNKEYQRVLEQNILKLSHKSFHQIVVLGSSSFIPFMQLTANNRRQVIEDLLDINVFSKMNIILKEQMAITRDNIKDIEYTIDIEKARLEAAKKNLAKVRAINSEHRAQKKSLIAYNKKEIKKLEKKIKEIQSIIPNRVDIEAEISEWKHERDKATREKEIREHELQLLVKHAKFLDKNDHCPTCEQEIDEDFKSSEKKRIATKGNTFAADHKRYDALVKDVTDKISRLNDHLEEINQYQTTIHGYQQSISQLQNTINTLQDDIDNLQSGAGDISEVEIEIAKFKENIEELKEKKDAENDMASYQRVMLELLKDTGIKTKIIKQYLPVINQLVNQYLQVLDFFVHFNLDEGFNETIKSRHRDLFSYDSFSEGEKQRIDLALLFTWRQIAKMKNSVATNLLVLDETFDSSLDTDGVDNLMKILHTLDDDTNVFIISHKTDALEGKFEHKIEFSKQKNFSVMV